MAGLRTNMIRGGALLSLVVLFSACSEKATCALEGCTKNESKVELKSGDSQNALDAKADSSKADKEAIEKAVKDLKDRLELGESIDKVQNDMLHIHETRLAALELKVTQIDTSIAGLNTKIAAAEAAIDANKSEIERVESELKKAISDGDDALRDDLTKKMERLVAAEAELREGLAVRVAALETFRIAQLALNELVAGDISEVQVKVAAILKRLEAVEDKADANESASAALADLVTSLQGSVASLSSGLADQTSLLSAALTRLQAVEGQASTSAAQITQILTDIGVLRADVNKLRSDLTKLGTDTTAALALLDNAIKAKTSCEITVNYKNGKAKSKTITCGSQSIEIKLGGNDDHDD